MTRRQQGISPWALAVALAVASVAQGGEELPIDRGLGQRVEDFTLTDAATGQEVALRDFADKRGVVLVFLGTSCPIGDLYMPRLQQLADRYEPRGIAFLGINSDEGTSPRAIAEHARAFGVRFPVLRDEGNRVADQVAAARTCEALLLDGERRLIYRGAIDDQYRFGPVKAVPEVSFLGEAIEALLDGRAVATPATPVAGCPIQRGRVEVPPYRTLPRISPPAPELIAAYEEVEGTELPDVGEVTYSGQVAAILQAKCQACHRPGQVGPFSLLTYDDARRWATSIWEVVEDRRMPPWHADPRYGHFEGARRLTPEERATLIAWVEQDTPLGDPDAIPPNPEYPEGWTIGTPDLVVEMPEPFLVPAEGVIDYQRFLVQTDFGRDIWIQAAEARPGDRRVVHHIIAYLVDPEDPRRREHLCGYAPGDMPSIFPPGVGKRIPAGATLLLELHYTPSGKATVDRSRVGFILAREPVQRRAITHGIAETDFEIPPGAADHPVSARFEVPEDSLLLSFMPHMHLRGKSFEYRATFPDGREEILLSIPSYDFNWQSHYRLAEPLRLPKGTVIECEARYNNSSSNPALTADDIRKPIRWGDQTFDEMMIGYIDYVPDVPVDAGTADRAVESGTPRSESESPSASLATEPDGAVAQR